MIISEWMSQLVFENEICFYFLCFRSATALASCEASVLCSTNMNFSHKTYFLLWSMSDILRQLLDNIAVAFSVWVHHKSIDSVHYYTKDLLVPNWYNVFILYILLLEIYKFIQYFFDCTTTSPLRVWHSLPTAPQFVTDFFCEQYCAAGAKHWQHYNLDLLSYYKR